MVEIKRVALAGKGRLGSPTVDELVKAGFQVTVLTRSAKSLNGIPSGVEVREVDYDSEGSLTKALSGQDALVSTVAMSGIENQKRLIDAAIAAGVKHFIPAEYSISTRDPKAQWLPMYTSVIGIQKYLESRDRDINWNVVNPGALLEFCLDYPFLVDFDNKTATIYDGGENAVSVATCPLTAKAIAAVLKQTDRVKDHCVQIHGGTLTQNQTLDIAKRYSQDQWTTQQRDAETEIQTAMDKIKSGTSGNELLNDLLITMAAATFGSGHFSGAYANPDNDWLGVDLFPEGTIEEFIRKRVVDGAYSVQSSTERDETLLDVTDSFVPKRSERDG